MKVRKELTLFVIFTIFATSSLVINDVFADNEFFTKSQTPESFVSTDDLLFEFVTINFEALDQSIINFSFLSNTFEIVEKRDKLSSDQLIRSWIGHGEDGTSVVLTIDDSGLDGSNP